MLKQRDEKETLRLFAARDESAFKKIYYKFSPQIFQVARSFLKSDELAKDMVQDIFLTMLEKRNFDAIEQFQFYIFVATRNRCLKFLKKQNDLTKASQGFVREVGVYDMSSERLDELRNIEDLERLVHQAIGRLPEKRQRIFIDYVMKGFKYDAIARKMNISESTVHNQVVQGRKDVLKYLKHHASFSFLILSSWLDNIH